MPEVENTAKLKWMTSPILRKMVQRRLAKERDALCNLLDRETRQECMEAKDNLLTEQCQLIEQLDAAHKTNFMHTHISDWRQERNVAMVRLHASKPKMELSP